MPLTSTRTLHYRNASFLLPSELTLEQALKNAAANAPLAAQRMRAAGGVHQVLNSHGIAGNTWCAMVHKWVDGQNSTLFEQDPNAPVWKVTQMAPPATLVAGGKLDFLETTVYFGVRDNHVVLVQSFTMRDSELALYITWLLQTHAASTATEAHVTFNPASASKLRALGVQRAKGIRIKRSIADVVLCQPVPGDGRRKAYEQKVINPARANGAAGALAALDIPVSPAIFGMADAAELEIELRITRPRGGDDLSNGVMNQIGSLVAQQTSDAYSVEMPDGSFIAGGDLKLSKDVVLAVPAAGAHPLPQDVFKEIDDYLRHLITSGKV